MNPSHGRSVVLLASLLLATACGSGDDSASYGDAGGSGADSASGNGSDGGMSETDGAPSPGTDGGGTANDAANPGDSGSRTSPVVGGCAVFPPNDAWNTDISGASIDATWTANLMTYANLKFAHPDFGSANGIPYNVVPQNQTLLPVTFGTADESDPGPYPFPGGTAKIEGGTPTSCTGDCHVLALQQGVCQLYEGDGCLFNPGNSTWACNSGAKWDLSKLQAGQRTAGFTSADAAGLPIFAGLARFDEMMAGEIRHAIRFTMHCTQDGYVTPASHRAVPNQCPPGISNADLRAKYPPMGTHMRLQGTYDTSKMSAQAKIVAVAMQKYGLILADNGSDYFFQGDPNPGWDDDQLNDLKAIPSSAFEVLTMPPIMH